MDQGKRKLATSLLAAASLTTAAASVKAQTFAEPGDAGQTLATARFTGTNNTAALTSITGTIAGTNGLDADLYVLTITNTTTFSAIASSGTPGIDTSLFLFNASGVAIIANDDANGTTLQGAIPAGNSLLTTLAPGRYYLGISLSGNEPVNLANQQLFTVDQPTTNIRGIASGLNPTTLSAFNGQTFFAEGGAYSIALTGAATAVPEPSTVVSLVLGAGASLAFVRRIRRQQAA